MFTGITQGLCSVLALEKSPHFMRYTLQLSPEMAQALTCGASVAVNGVCQTVVDLTIDHQAIFEAIQETLDKTTLGALAQGDWVSIERSCRLGDEIGGHCVAGHVIGTACIVDKIAHQDNVKLTIQCDPEWMPYILPKGFIAIDGSSLTVCNPSPEGRFEVHLIPETLRVTQLGRKSIGAFVNIELDAQTRAIVDTVLRVLEQRR